MGHRGEETVEGTCPAGIAPVKPAEQQQTDAQGAEESAAFPIQHPLSTRPLLAGLLRGEAGALFELGNAPGLLLHVVDPPAPQCEQEEQPGKTERHQRLQAGGGACMELARGIHDPRIGGKYGTERS